MQLDLSTQQCLREVNNIGETVVMNICNGTQTVVPWGTADWFAVSLMGFFMLFVATFFCGLLYTAISSERRWRKRYP